MKALAQLQQNKILLCAPDRFNSWAKFALQNFTSAKIEDDKDWWGDPIPKMEVVNGVSVIPICGPIMQGIPKIFKKFGYCDVDDIEDAFDSTELPVVFDIDSPGGAVSGIPEFGDKVYAAIRAGRKVYAVSSGMCCSGAYWIASQCVGVYCAGKTSEVGSIGVYQAFEDYSRMYNDAGISVEMFTTGQYKGMGYPGTSLTDAQRAEIQAGVDYLFAMFKETVKRTRSKVPDECMQGQSFFGEQAAANGLVHGFATVDDLIKRLTS